MAKVKLNVTKLGDPTVNYISLVSRGANRIPFRIVKREQEPSMIDLASLSLSRLFKGEKATPESTVPNPTIVGFVTMKDDNFDTVKKHLQDAGYKIADCQEETDGSVVFKQQLVMPEEFAVVKMSDTLLVLIDGVDPELAVKGTIYESFLTEDNFLPSHEIATKGLQLAMGEISNADEPIGDKVAKMEMVTKDYNGYLSKLFNWVPAQLNVMAALLEKEIAARAGVKPEATVEELRGVPASSASDPTDKLQNINQAAGINATGTPAPSAFATALPTDDKKAVSGVTKSELKSTTATTDPVSPDNAENTKVLLEKMEALFGTLQSSIGEQIGDITAQVNTLKASVESIKKSQDILHDRVVETEKVAKSADSTIRSTLITSSATDDSFSVTRKSANGNDEGYGGCIDTAFQGTVRKAAQPIQRGRASR